MSNEDPVSLSRRRLMQATAVGLVASQTTLAKASPKSRGKLSAADAIVARLVDGGATHFFGVPGATCDPLFAAAHAQPAMEVVVTASDLEAGYAADGFARVRGLSALSVTYGVGTMSLIGVIAGADAERSPIVVLNGGPSGTDLKLQRDFDTYFSHSSGREKTDLTLFREVTAFAARAEKASEIPGLLDKAIETALLQRRPAYLEIPKHLWTAKVTPSTTPFSTTPAPSGKESEVAEKIRAQLARAKAPLLVLGVEVQRYGLADNAKALVSKLGIPYTTTMLGKAAIPEGTPGFAGVYAGARSVPAMTSLVETSDAIFTVGCVFGRQYRNLATKNSDTLVVAANGQVRFGGQVKRAATSPASLSALLDALLDVKWTKNASHAARNPLSGRTFEARRTSLKGARAASQENGLTYDGVLSAVSASLNSNNVVVTDTSLSMYPAADLDISDGGAFVCNGVWQSIGFSVGAAVGVALAKAVRPVVICGDGGFQMTAQSLSTMARRNLPCTVVVLDNGHYGIEQFLLDPRFFQSPKSPQIPYLDLNRWDYAAFATALGFKHASAVSAVGAFETALAAAQSANAPSFIAVRVKKRDLPAQLQKPRA